MNFTRKHTNLILSVTIFILFFSYYFVTSNLLPNGAGPDWKANTSISRFIYQHGRLAVLPDDTELLHFTEHGGTRALRPPLSYIVSAAAAKTFSFTELDSHVLFRKGSALLCALAIALTFYALSIYFSSITIGILGSSIIGLMPQFTFIASYNNDDSGAIFSATLMLAVLVRIYRYGASTGNAALIGFAAGLIVLSKMSAWLLMPIVILFLVFFIRAPWRRLLQYTGIAGVVFILSGGWWFGFNIYHYGIDDPIQKKITDTVVEQQRRLPPGEGLGYASRGIGFYELLIQNHKNFLGATLESTIGNLDWLKLKLGPLQYTAYKSIFFFALIYYFFSLITYPLKRFKGELTDSSIKRKFTFESLLILIILFQIFMYMWTNIHNDIQVQGKYLMPVFLAVLILFFSGLKSLSGIFTSFVSRLSSKGPVLDSAAGLRLTGVIGALLFVVYIHWHAMKVYVIPFYMPQAYDVRLGEFQALSLQTSMHQDSSNLNIWSTGNGIEYIATGEDPKTTMSNELCKLITGTVMLQLEFYSDTADTLQFFVDEGDGYSAKNSFSSKYDQGDNTLLLPIAANQCQRLRFDPFYKSGRILLKKLQIATMFIRQKH